VQLDAADWTWPVGIKIDRSTLPPDDEITEAQAEIAGLFDSAIAGVREETDYGHHS